MQKSTDIISNLNKKDPDGFDKNGNPYKVLIVDDSTVMRKMVSQYLRSESYEVIAEAVDGKDAIDKYKELSPDVVTMDINMPQMNGIESLKAILDYDPKAVVVMLTSEGQKQTVVEAISLGAKNFIVKPPDRGNVLDKVKSALADK